MAEFDFISPTDKPALLGISTPEYLSACMTALHELDFKIHAASEHEDFVSRFGQIQYQVVVIEERFACTALPENLALQRVQYMPMAQRRHALVVLIGESFQSLNTMQAFQQSVHAVINPSDLRSIKQVLQQLISENALFFNVYRDTQNRMAQGKI